MDDLAKLIGLEDQHPTIRSSDLKPQDEFLYMLTRRFGLVPKLQYSVALNRGSWFHRRCELFHCTRNQAHQALRPALLARCSELLDLAEQGGFDGQPLVNREEEDYDTAFSWYDAAAQVPLSTETTICASVSLKAGATFKDFILDPAWRILGTEVLIALEDGRVAQIDLLLFNVRSGLLWLVDMKTTAKAANDRLALCSIESQTLHYPRVVRDALPLIIDKFDLPSGTLVGGMLHVAVSKPAIQFGPQDRDFEWVDTFYKVTCKGGKKGDFKSKEKRWMSDTPQRANYIARCADWYRGTGDYTDKAEERAAKPMVAIGSTPASSIFDPVREGWYQRKLERTRELATRPLSYAGFPPEDHTLGWGSTAERPYEPFYVLPPVYWPSIIERDFIVQDRDRDTPPAPSVTVLGANPYVTA